MAREPRTLRLHETIQPFGVGAIADIAGDSLVAVDISWWPDEARRLQCHALEQQLGVSHFRTPPSVPDRPSRESPGLVYARFPAWRFCQNCRRMSRQVKRVQGIPRNECKHCHGPMVPMRFIAICEEGSHMRDIPWRHWAHRDSTTEEQRQCQDEDRLEFIPLEGRGEGLNSIGVVCRACSALRTLASLSGKGALTRDGYKCQGRQPWQDDSAANECDAPVQAVQRGSTSVHESIMESAIDIPLARRKSEALRAEIRAHSLFSRFAADPTGPTGSVFAEVIANELGVEPHRIHGALDDGTNAPLAARHALRAGEWAAIESALASETTDFGSDFVVEPSDDPFGGEAAELLGPLVSGVGLAHRLREVRAMTHFRRYKAEARALRVDLDLIPHLDWYPATEQFGEGVFVRIDETALRHWEQRFEASDRLPRLEARRVASAIAERFESVSGRRVLLHTLAHLLIRRLAFTSGYSSASLRERIYAEGEGPDPQAGILIYTAAGDSEGTLGGLVRQGKKENLGRLLLGAIEDADFCSNDPVCRESRGQGMNAFNYAACHGCCLVSETSCENSNVFLDRLALVGSDSVPGFFQDALGDGRSRTLV
jgi:hypothetical protein